MKLNETPRLAINDPLMQREFREHATQVNLLADGRISAVNSSRTAAPTTGDWKQGDFVRNSTPTVINLHGAGHDYVIIGWICLTSGTPGTWGACHCHLDH
jgi:hypothetical protein